MSKIEDSEKWIKSMYRSIKGKIELIGGGHFKRWWQVPYNAKGKDS